MCIWNLLPVPHSAVWSRPCLRGSWRNVWRPVKTFCLLKYAGRWTGQWWKLTASALLDQRLEPCWCPRMRETWQRGDNTSCMWTYLNVVICCLSVRLTCEALSGKVAALKEGNQFPTSWCRLELRWWNYFRWMELLGVHALTLASWQQWGSKLTCRPLLNVQGSHSFLEIIFQDIFSHLVGMTDSNHVIHYTLWKSDLKDMQSMVLDLHLYL